MDVEGEAEGGVPRSQGYTRGSGWGGSAGDPRRFIGGPVIQRGIGRKSRHFRLQVF